MAGGRKASLRLAILVEMYVAHMLGSLIIVWICNRAREASLWRGDPCGGQYCSSVHSDAGLASTALDLLVTVLVLIVIDRMWKKLPSDHPAVYSRKYEIKGDLVDETGQT